MPTDHSADRFSVSPVKDTGMRRNERAVDVENGKSAHLEIPGSPDRRVSLAQLTRLEIKDKCFKKKLKINVM